MPSGCRFFQNEKRIPQQAKVFVGRHFAGALDKLTMPMAAFSGYESVDLDIIRRIHKADARRAAIEHAADEGRISGAAAADAMVSEAPDRAE